MKKKVFTILFALFAIATTAQSSEEIIICGVTITDELAAQGNLVPMLNKKEDVTATGNITFNVATQTLVLDNADVVYSPDNERPVIYFTTWTKNFTIQLKGANKLKNAYTGYTNAVIIPNVQEIHVTITGEGSLEVTSLNWYAISLQGGKLTIDNTTLVLKGREGISYNSGIGGALYVKKSNVTATQINALSAIELTDCSIVQPEGAFVYSEDWYDGGKVYYIDKNGSNADIVISSGTTGIEANSCEPLNNNHYYSIDGKKLSDEPTKKGVYIIKGKKVKR